MRYVKVCPRCGHVNDELAEICAQDGEFLGMVPATPAPPEPAPVSAPVESPSPPSPVIDAALPEGLEQTPPAPVLYLDSELSGQCFPVRSSQVVGQAHAENDAEVQLPMGPGVQYVHRKHCRFDYAQGEWSVIPIAQPDFTNPTAVNDRKVAPGERMPVRNGDRLALSAIRFTIRILPT